MKSSRDSPSARLVIRLLAPYGGQADMAMRTPVNAVSRHKICWPSLIKENERSNHLALRWGPHTPHFKATKIPRSRKDNCFYAFEVTTVGTSRIEGSVPANEFVLVRVWIRIRLSPNDLEHDLVPAEKWQRPRRVIERVNGFADNREILGLNIVPKFRYLCPDQGIVCRSRKSNDNHSLCWNRNQIDTIIFRYRQSLHFPTLGHDEAYYPAIAIALLRHWRCHCDFLLTLLLDGRRHLDFGVWFIRSKDVCSDQSKALIDSFLATTLNCRFGCNHGIVRPELDWPIGSRYLILRLFDTAHDGTCCCRRDTDHNDHPREGP